MTYIPFYRAGVRHDIHSKRAQTAWANSNKKSQHDSSLESAMANSQKVTITKHYILTLYEKACSIARLSVFRKQVQSALWITAWLGDLQRQH